MFRTFSFHTLLAILFVFSFSDSELNAQIPEHELPAVKKQSLDDFQAGNFRAAESNFEKLMKQFPRDPMYRYYTGICKIEQNKDLEEAAELLVFASSRGVPEDVYYYLGEAYRKLYDFEKAKKYFIEFDKEAPRGMTREKNSKLLIRSVVSAMQITSTYNPFEVLNVTFVNMSDPDQFRQVKMTGGDLVRKPEVFFSPDENKEDLNSLMFMPRILERGKSVYFAGYDKGAKNGFQILQARKGPTGKWTDIKSLDALNTEKDEILPYFDPVGKDLYFASNGREGLGGFDLYRAHYDEERDEWTDPINVGFPVNSAFDDYLLLPGSDLGMVIFFSGRQGSDTAMTVYRVHLSEPKRSLASSTPQEIRRIANLGNIADDVLRDYESFQEESDRTQLARVRAADATPEMKMEKAAASGVDVQYQQLINQALRHQAISDSLTELASAARVKVRESEDPNDRWLYQKQIMVWEKRAQEEQKLADDRFVSVNTYTAGDGSGTGNVVPPGIKKDTVINEITVYKFVTADSITAKARESFQKPAPDEVKTLPALDTKTVVEREPVNELPESEPLKTTEIQNRFQVLGVSPYSENSPIPMDTPLPKGSFYRIQLGVFSKAVAPDVFGGLAPISGETMPDRGLIKYYVGKFSRYEDARDALPRVREQGYQDAFIVSWYNGGKMSPEKVQKLEQ